MMRGLIAKTFHEVWLMTLLFGAALLAVNALLTYVLPQVQQGLDGVFDQSPLVRSMLTALLGTELGDKITARTMQAFLWVHPVVLSLIWAHEIAFCTRVPAGEIDRGTIDVLLGLPVSRRTLYCCESLAWLSTGLVILLMGFAGHRLSAPTMPEQMRPELTRAALVLVNLYCVYVAVGGIAFLASAIADRRGRAMAAVFAIVLASFLLNFVAQFWAPAQQVAFLGVLEYYQPAVILQGGGFPLRDAAILLAVGGSAWAIAGEVFARRDICTV